MSALYPGQRVICIDGKLSPDAWEWTSEIPREGEIYTIQRVYDGTNRISGRREAAPRHRVAGKRSPAQLPPQSSFHEYQSRIPSSSAKASTSSYSLPGRNEALASFHMP